MKHILLSRPLAQVCLLFLAAATMSHAAVTLDTSGSPVLMPVAKDFTTSPGTRVRDFIETAGNKLVVTGAGTSKGIAVTGVSGSGTWQYATNGSTWQNFGSPSPGAARLLSADADTRVRFVPSAGATGTMLISYKGWDGTGGSEGATADATAGANFSTTTESASLLVAPTYDPGSASSAATTFAVNSGFHSSMFQLANGNIVSLGRANNTIADGVAYRLTIRDTSFNEIVNADTTLFDGYHVTATAAPLSGGGFVVVYSDGSGTSTPGANPEGSGNLGIFFRLYDSAGGIAGSAMRAVATTTAGAQFLPRVAPLANGGFIASWVDQSGANQTIRYRRFDAEGNALDPSDVNLPAQGADGITDYTIRDGVPALLNDGRVAFWWSSGTSANRGGYISILDGDGNLLDEPGGPANHKHMAFRTTDAATTWYCTVTGLSDGGLMHTYAVQTDAPGGTSTANRSMNYRVLSSTLSLVNDQFLDVFGGVQFYHSTARSGLAHPIAGLLGGGYVQPRLSSAGEMTYGLFDNAGDGPALASFTVVASGLTVPTTSAGTEAGAFPLQSGGYGLRWRDASGNLVVKLFQVSAPVSTSAPTVTTAAQSGVTHNSATLGGNVTADGGASVTERGIVWGSSADPTTSNNKVQIGSGTGAFSQLVTGLPASTTVHVRAYAINSAGTNYGGNISFTTSAPPPSADLSLDIADSADPVHAGGAFSYSLSVSNAGPSTATSVSVSCTLPPGVGFVSASGTGWSCGESLGVVTCTRPSLAPGAAPTITINVTAPGSAGDISCTASVSSAATDSNAANDSDSETTTVTVPPGFSMAFAPDTIAVGGVSTLTFTIDNTANSVAATSINFTVNFPAPVTVASPANAMTTVTGGTLTATAGTSVISHTGGAVAAGSTATVQVDVTCGTLGSHVTTTGDLTSSLGNSGTATDTLTVTETPSLVVTTTMDTSTNTDGLTSLREALAYANSGSAGASPVITFASPLFDTAQTITLNGSQLPTITRDLTITGPGADVLTIDGNNASRVFQINDGTATVRVVAIENVTITHGRAAPGEAGGILNYEDLTLRAVRVTDCYGQNGAGGLQNQEGTVLIEDSVFSGNSGHGGLINYRGAVMVRRSSFLNNVATFAGGGLSNSGGTMTIEHSTISGNMGPQFSGAIINNSGGVLTVRNSTLSGNNGGVNGGVTYNYEATATFIQNTITGNTATNGGAFVNETGTLTLKGNILSGNGQEIKVNSGTVIADGYNLFSDSSRTNSTAFAGFTPGPSDITATSDGTHPTALASILAPLADNGGPTLTHALPSGSPAIDAGDPAFDPNAFTPPLTTDQRGSGFDRVVRGSAGLSARIDIGAFEVQTTPAPEITVYDGTLAGTELTDDTGTVDFGSVGRLATSAARVFTIQNTGTAPLSGIAVTKGAAGQPGEFDLDTTGMSASLLAGESTTFTVALTPGAFGSRGAVLEIASTDEDENPFEVHLIGEGVPPEFTAVTDEFMMPTVGMVGGGQIYRPLTGVINQEGFVTFTAVGAVGTGGITAGNDSLLLSDASGTLRVVAREGHLVETSPWQTLAGAFSHFLLTEDGQTVALDRIAGAASTSDYAYLASPDGVALEILSREGDAAPSAGTFKLHTAKPAADTQGRVYFSGDLTGAGVTSKDDSGIYQASAGTVVEIIREGDDVSALTGDPAWLGGVGVMVAAAGDGAAFTALLQNNPADAKDKTDTARNALVLAGNENGLVLVARKGDVVPDTGGARMRTFSGVSRGGADSHAYLGLLTTGGGVTTANDQVLVAVTGTGSHLVARKGVTVVDGVTLSKFGDFYTTSGAEVVFEASGVLCRWTEGGGVVALARLGGMAPGMGGATFTTLSKLSVSEGGAIALMTNLSDGRRALWRALPGAALQSVVVSGTTITVGGVLKTIYTLDIDGRGAGTGGGGGGMGSAINDDGFVYATLSLGNGQHVGKVYP